MAKLSKEAVKARIKGEQTRALENIAARTERPEQMWWLSFAAEDGFRGAVIVHAEDFITAVMECDIRGINPHGECQGMPVPLGNSIPDKWKYRILSRDECAELAHWLEKCHRAALKGDRNVEQSGTVEG